MSDFQNLLDENLSRIQINSIEETDSFETYDIYQEIRDKIILLRHKKVLTQKELAMRAKLTQANISNIEKGVSKPTIDSLKKIADVTGTRLVVDFVDQEV